MHVSLKKKKKVYPEDGWYNNEQTPEASELPGIIQQPYT